MRANVTYPQPASTPVTFTAEATGGSGPAYFQFWVSRYEDTVPSWRVIQDFSLSSTCQWVPIKTGNYIVIVYVSSQPNNADPYPELAGMTLVVE
jgi:hypothetical protein